MVEHSDMVEENLGSILVRWFTSAKWISVFMERCRKVVVWMFESGMESESYRLYFGECTLTDPIWLFIHSVGRYHGCPID